MSDTVSVVSKEPDRQPSVSVVSKVVQEKIKQPRKKPSSPDKKAFLLKRCSSPFKLDVVRSKTRGRSSPRAHKPRRASCISPNVRKRYRSPTGIKERDRQPCVSVVAKVVQETTKQPRKKPASPEKKALLNKQGSSPLKLTHRASCIPPDVRKGYKSPVGIKTPIAQHAKPSYVLFLLGKTGHGKSATGNSIVGRRTFKSSACASSVTYSVSSAWSERDDCVVKVVDGPGIGETRLQKHQSVEKAQVDMAKAMTMCTEGFHAMLIVFKFGHRFTQEEQDSIDFLKGMLGQDVFRKFGICVMTCGDLFTDAMEEDGTPGISPLEWSLNQGSKFAHLLKECGCRVALFDNRTKNKIKRHMQVEDLLHIVKNLPNGGVRYSNAQFVAMHHERQKLIVKCKLPQMEEEMQRKCSLLEESLKRISWDHDDIFKKVADLKRKAKSLVNQIYEKDQGTMVLMPLKTIVDSLLFTIDKFEAAETEKNQQMLKNQIKNMEEELREKEKKYDETLKEMREKAEDHGFLDSLVSFGNGVIAPFSYITRKIGHGALYVGETLKDRIVKTGEFIDEQIDLSTYQSLH